MLTPALSLDGIEKDEEREARMRRWLWRLPHTCRGAFKKASIKKASSMPRLLALGLAVLAGATLATASAAGATAYTWTGASSSTAAWSAASNWGGAAPTAGSAVDLSFPRLERAACNEEPLTQACYLSENDSSGLTVESMSLDDGDIYEIWGKQIALGGGGLSASPATGSSGPAGDLVELPIELTAQQSWSVVQHSGGAIGENGIALFGELTGAHPLSLNISEGAAVYMAANAEVGAVTIAGTNASGAGVFNGYGALLESQLNATDGSSVDLSHIFFIADGSTGPLSTHSAEVDVGSGYPAGGLSAASATFDAGSEIEFKVSGAGDTPGRDYSQLVSSGAVDLGDARLFMHVIPPSEGGSCPFLTPGTQYTLISTTGGLTGEFANAPEGGEIPIKFAKEGCTQLAQYLKISYNRTGPTQTVVGTVIAGASSSTSLSVSSASVTTNQEVTLTATVTATAGTPSGTVEFIDGGVPMSNCPSQPVGWSGSSYAATCRTTFAASSSPERLSARFAPGREVNLNPSTSGTEEVIVSKDATTISLTVSNSTPQVDESVVYSAYLNPTDPGAARPSGVIEFLDGGTPIGSCASQPLSLSGGAVCEISYQSPVAHSIAARYAGDANFSASTSPAQSVAVQQQPGVPSTKPSVPPLQMPSNAWLMSQTLVVKGNGWTIAKIACEGIGACDGKLLLQVRQAGRKGRGRTRHARLVTLGEADFSVAGSTSATVALPTGHLGLSLLKAHHGRLAARLVIAQAKPHAKKAIAVHLRLALSRRRHGK